MAKLPHIYFLGQLELSEDEIISEFKSYRLENAKAKKLVESKDLTNALSVSNRIIEKIIPMLDEEDFSEEEIEKAKQDALSQFSTEKSTNGQTNNAPASSDSKNDLGIFGWILGGAALIGGAMFLFKRKK
jgi:predicted Zn-dependent peptidase